MHLLLRLFLLLIVLSCGAEPEIPQLETPSTGITTPPLTPEPLSLVWADEFDGDELNLDNWTFELGDGCPNLCGWGNNELQIYTDNNHRLENGILIISAKKRKRLFVYPNYNQRKARIPIRKNRSPG